MTARWSWRKWRRNIPALSASGFRRKIQPGSSSWHPGYEAFSARVRFVKKIDCAWKACVAPQRSRRRNPLHTKKKKKKQQKKKQTNKQTTPPKTQPPPTTPPPPTPPPPHPPPPP